VDRAGLDDDDLHAEAGHLVAERVRDGLERVLGGVVRAGPRERDAAAHRRHLHDPAPAGGAHGRQRQLAQPHRAEDIGLELAA
jgi:hypothetical protein